MLGVPAAETQDFVPVLSKCFHIILQNVVDFVHVPVPRTQNRGVPKIFFGKATFGEEDWVGMFDCSVNVVRHVAW